MGFCFSKKQDGKKMWTDDLPHPPSRDVIINNEVERVMDFIRKESSRNEQEISVVIESVKTLVEVLVKSNYENKELLERINCENKELLTNILSRIEKIDSVVFHGSGSVVYKGSYKLHRSKDMNKNVENTEIS